MAIIPINIGTVPNDDTGDPIRDAFIKVNGNDADLDGRVTTNTTNISTNTANITTNTTAFNAKNGKDIVRVATTANTNLTATQTIDGIAVVIGDRILVKNQTIPSENGIYIVQAAAWTRSTDANTSAKVISGMRTTVRQGTANRNTAWHLTTTGTIVLDTTGLTFEQYADVGGAPVTESLIIAVGNETTTLTTGVAKVTFRMPYAFTLSSVRTSLTAASTSGVVTADINETGATILSTKLTIDANEKTSQTAATPPVITDTSLTDDAEITIDIDTAGTGAAGLKITLIGQQT